MDSEEFVYTLRQAAPVASLAPRPPGDAITVDADSRGNVLFRNDLERVEPDKFERGLANVVRCGKAIIEKASSIAANYEVDKITMKLALDAKVGVVFAGEGSLEASIEVEIKRVHPKPAAPSS
jgi:hypothetical protein